MKFIIGVPIILASAATVAAFVCTDKYYPYPACCSNFSTILPNYCLNRVHASTLAVNHFGPEPLFTCRNSSRSVGGCCEHDDTKSTNCLPFAVADANSS